MYTEEEAKTKWCQETFRSRLMPNYCHASECMAWRWADIPEGMYKASKSTTHGYCGKAGKP